LELRPGDEVITSPLTFCSTVNVILHAEEPRFWPTWKPRVST
jgi:dTDP-4-amino-4,6-dideoxygalactose transaminase